MTAAPDTVEVLKPCPFCGGDELSHGHDMGRGVVQCHECNAYIVTGDESDAIASWNRRTSYENDVAIDVAAIEASSKRWHGLATDHFSVRWEPYKPDGQRQMKAKGRWQRTIGSGDYWRWVNCDRPSNLKPEPTT